MRTSQYFLPTLKETPADAEVISHQLMLRAGMIRQVAAGVYNWLPLGLKVLKKVENIVREEMNRSGALEVFLPMVQPANLWHESNRWDQFGPELLRIKDRHKRDFCLGPTHEEVITDIVRSEIRSYKQLPLNLYQIQTKFRDEIRPRFGIMRGREFLMKDAYSFNISEASLQETYDIMYRTYRAIFDRLELKYRAVDADSGSIGGSVSHEFHVLADSGEDALVFSDQSDYAANIETAQALAVTERQAPKEAMRLVDTPNTKTIAALVESFDMPVEKTIKTLVVKASDDIDSEFVALLVRGDHELNPLKAEKLVAVKAPLEMAKADDINRVIGAGPGSLGPVNLPIPFITDETVAQMSDFGAGANIDDKHYFGINWERDVSLQDVADIRNVVIGDPSPDGQGTLNIARGIEVGHIFQLGDKYSTALNANVLDENGKSVTLKMGCYGIGVSRVVAAAIEQNHDEHGIIWPDVMAPFKVALVAIGYHKSEAVKSTIDRLYQDLQQENVEVLLDDRNERMGTMLADIELIGIPHIVIVGDRGLKEGQVEYRKRKTGEKENVPTDNLLASLKTKLSH